MGGYLETYALFILIMAVLLFWHAAESRGQRACPHVELSHSKLSTQQPCFSQKYKFRRDLSCPGIVKLLIRAAQSSPTLALHCVFCSHHHCAMTEPLFRTCWRPRGFSSRMPANKDTNSSTSKCLMIIPEQSASSPST